MTKVWTREVQIRTCEVQVSRIPRTEGRCSTHSATRLVDEIALISALYRKFSSKGRQWWQYYRIFTYCAVKLHYTCTNVIMNSMFNVGGGSVGYLLLYLSQLRRLALVWVDLTLVMLKDSARCLVSPLWYIVFVNINKWHLSRKYTVNGGDMFLLMEIIILFIYRNPMKGWYSQK